MGRLQRVVWEGQGSRLLSEVSKQPVVKKFLEAVPYIMNTVRDIHSAVIENDLEGIIRLSSDPIPPQILSSRDPNNMTVMHKAAGLGYNGILKYIIERYPQGVNDVDNEGKAPLHYAASVRDEQHTYNTLVDSGADESIVDNKNRTAGYYVNKGIEIDKNIFKVLPEAPRTPSSAYPSSWDWKILNTDFINDYTKKSRKKNTKASNENISSKNNTSNISESTENNNNLMKGSNTYEAINNLPDLNESDKPNITNGKNNQKKETIQDTEDNGTIEQEECPKTDAVVEQEEKDLLPNEKEETNLSDNNHNDHEPYQKNIDDNIDENSDQNNSENININDENEQHVNENVDNECNESKDVLEDTNENNEMDEAKDNLEAAEKSNLNKSLQKDTNEKNLENDGNSQVDVENVENEDIDVLDSQDDSNKEIVHNNDSTESLNENIADQDQLNIPDNKNDNQQVVENNDDEVEKKHTNSFNENKNEEELNSSPYEGNNISDNNEDDDDVQVQEISHHDNTNSTSITSAKIRQSNGSAKRGNLNNARNIRENYIEGIISNEAEQETLDASILQGSVNEDILIVDNEIDPEVTELINTANMEMLATLVLNGEGSRLIGRHSGNLELQAFLDNVPAYMQKINKVHIAAKEGNLSDLQAALDRRKFAIARDPISPNGATPLHVATIFGKTNIVKYLGGRFPETLSAVDFEGRTALHYAAVLPDNGHYYNLLQQLGANSKDLDDSGKSAEDFYKNPTLLPFNQLLSDFSINEETAKTMFSDKVPDDHVSSRRDLELPEVLDTLQRCYRLLASARPTRTPLSASSNKATPPNVVGRFLRKSIFDGIKLRVTKLDHNLFDVIWPALKKLPDNRNIVQTVEEDFPAGVTAPDYYVYNVFTEFLSPLVKDLHNLNVHTELYKHPISDFVNNAPVKDSSEPIVEINVDPSNQFVLSGTIECSRNIEGFEMPLNLKIGKLETIERIITTLLLKKEFTKIIEQLSPESDQKGGTYYTLNEVLEKPSEICAILASSGLLVALCDREEIDDYTRLHGKHWPYGRGVFVSDDKSVAIWINIHDHLRVLLATPLDAPGEIGIPFSKMTYIMSYLNDHLDFVWHYKLGHLSSRPTFLGAGIRFSLLIEFPGLSKDLDNVKNLCAMRGLQYRETLSSNIARISNYQCLSINESNCFNDFITATSNLLHLEKDLSMQNSAHIATMLTNIFKRKRSSLVDVDGVDDRL